MPLYNLRIIVFTLVMSFLVAGTVGGATYWKLNQEIEELRENLFASQRITQA